MGSGGGPSTMELRVGAVTLFGLTAFVALMVGWKLDLYHWRRQLQYEAVFEHGIGLRTGLDVTLQGVGVGRVGEVDVLQDGRVRAVLEIDREWEERIREGTQAEAVYTLMGKIVNLKVAPGDSPKLEPGGRLEGRNFDPLYEAYASDLLATLDRLASVLADVADVAEQMSLGEGQLPATVDRLIRMVKLLDEALSALANREDGADIAALVHQVLGLLDAVSKLIEQVSVAATQLEAASEAMVPMTAEVTKTAASVERTAGSIDGLAAGLGKSTKSLDAAMSGVPAALKDIDETLDEFRLTLEAMRNLPLLKARVEKIEEGRETPAE